MSEYTPTRGELISALVAYRATQGPQTPAEVASSAPPKEIAKFLGEAERGLAEVERAAAEKALRGAALSGRFGTNAQSVLLELADSARAWNQDYLAASRDFMQNAPFENAAANPYRRNEGENEGEHRGAE